MDGWAVVCEFGSFFFISYFLFFFMVGKDVLSHCAEWGGGGVQIDR